MAKQCSLRCGILRMLSPFLAPYPDAELYPRGQEEYEVSFRRVVGICE
jgi:hypothetical protein